MRGLDWLAVIVGLLLFGLVGLLWSMKPRPVMWLAGSFAWARVTYPAFFWYVTRES